jgi:hypothetical protein
MIDKGSAFSLQAASLGALLVLLVACGEAPAPGREGPLETVEVGPPPDAELSLDEEVQAEVQRIRTGGVLPADFPSDFPTYPRSSLVDFGVSPAGDRFLLFDSGDRADGVQEAMSDRLRRAGWSPVAGEGGPGTAYARGGRAVRLEIRGEKAGSAILLYY